MHPREDLPDGIRAYADLVTRFRWIPATLVAVPVAGIRFVRHRCPQWAAALAYYSLFGLVPLLVAVFSLMKGAHLHRELTPYLVTMVGAGSKAVANQIVSFIDGMQTRAVGLIGAVAALVASFGILANAEMCLNTIWGGVPGRHWTRKVKEFAAVVVGGPLVLLMSLALTATLRSGSSTRKLLESSYVGGIGLRALDLLPFFLLWVSFTVIYTRMPNARVRRRSAAAGAVVAGTLWQFVQVTYMHFVIAAVQFSALYGALSQLPIMLTWIYFAWMIVLFGAEVSRAHHEVIEARLASAGPARSSRAEQLDSVTSIDAVAHDEDRAGGVANNFFSDASHHEVGQA